MRNRLRHALATAAAATLIALAGAGSASALNVGTIGTPIGSGTMTSTASGGALRLVINASAVFNCTTSTIAPSIGTGVYALPATIGTRHITLANCTGPLGLPPTVTCVPASYVITAAPTGGAAPGRFAGISCTIGLAALGCSVTVSGSVPIAHTNPTATTPAVVTVQVAGQALTAASSCPPAVVPSGPAQYGAPSGAGTGLTNRTFTFAGPSSGHPFLS